MRANTRWKRRTDVERQRRLKPTFLNWIKRTPSGRRALRRFIGTDEERDAKAAMDRRNYSRLQWTKGAQ